MPTGEGGALDPSLAFKPTPYSAALLQAGRHVLQGRRVSSALEIGVGSGVVMAGLLLAGVARFVGRDILPQALQTSAALLDSLGLRERARLELAPLWDGLDGQRFDLIVCNPPQFPLRSPLQEDHPAVWSDGGPDGRRILEPLLAGLDQHLQPGGVALLTHNVFVGLSQSRVFLERAGLKVSVVQQVMVPLSAERRVALARSHADWGRGERLEGEAGLAFIGPHAFAEFGVLCVQRPDAG